jgi:hypothetical protein
MATILSASAQFNCLAIGLGAFGLYSSTRNGALAFQSLGG